MKKAYLIDPTAFQSVREIEWSGKFTGPNGAYELLGVDRIEAARLEHGSVFFDEEGLGRHPHGFYIRDTATAIAGKGLIVGLPDVDGNETDVIYTKEWAASHVLTFELLQKGVVALQAPPEMMDVAHDIIRHCAGETCHHHSGALH
jgi:hypothetical protein